MNTSACTHCGEPIVQSSGRGRPKKYCSAQCRDAASWARRRPNMRPYGKYAGKCDRCNKVVWRLPAKSPEVQVCRDCRRADQSKSSEGGPRRLYIQKYGPVPDGHLVVRTCRDRECLDLQHLATVTPREWALLGWRYSDPVLKALRQYLAAEAVWLAAKAEREAAWRAAWPKKQRYLTLLEKATGSSRYVPYETASQPTLTPASPCATRPPLLSA